MFTFEVGQIRSRKSFKQVHVHFCWNPSTRPEHTESISEETHICLTDARDNNEDRGCNRKQ